jgi:hypothetical protein
LPGKILAPIVFTAVAIRAARCLVCRQRSQLRGLLFTSRRCHSAISIRNCSDMF